jgi:hypothetical protein
VEKFPRMFPQESLRQDPEKSSRKVLEQVHQNGQAQTFLRRHFPGLSTSESFSFDTRSREAKGYHMLGHCRHKRIWSANISVRILIKK